MDLILSVYRDIVLIDKGEDVLDLARELGYSKIYFKEDINTIGIENVEEYEKKRNLVESGKIKILLNPHLVSKKDSLHFRSSGLDQVLCKFMNKNKIAMGISLDKISNFVEIGRIKQNIKLCRKYKVEIKVFSFASNKFQLRNVKDLISFLEVLGMTPGEAKKSLN